MRMPELHQVRRYISYAKRYVIAVLVGLAIIIAYFHGRRTMYHEYFIVARSCENGFIEIRETQLFSNAPREISFKCTNMEKICRQNYCNE